MENTKEIGLAAQRVKHRLANLDTEQKNHLLATLAEILLQNTDVILQANAQDLQAAKEHGVRDAMLDRLKLNQQRIEDMAVGIRQVIQLPDPCHQVLAEKVLQSGVKYYKTTVPFGVILMIYEARPNVTIDAATLALKSGNAVILRGGKEALHTNSALTDCIRQALTEHQLPVELVQLVTSLEHEVVGELISMRDCIDLVIPRGGAGLIDYIVRHSLVPVIETGSGICHVYVDKSADLAKAIPIIMNAKVQRPSVCNAIESLLIHQEIAENLLEKLVPELQAAGVEIRGDEETCRLISGIEQATEADWATEYNDLILSVKIVQNEQEALDHIARYGTRHSECIVAEDPQAIEEFMQHVDAAAVYANASTRFTDGFEFGLGAEIGISTQKSHVRGPMGLEALVTYQYRLYGHGQIRS